MLISSGNTQAFTFGLSTVALTTNTGAPRFRDGRVDPGPSGVSQVRTDSNAGGTLPGTIVALSNTVVSVGDVNGVCVLSPGVGLNVIAGATNTICRVTFFYRERVAEPSELTF